MKVGRSSQVKWTDMVKAASSKTRTVKLPRPMRASPDSRQRITTVKVDAIEIRKSAAEIPSQCDTLTIPGTKSASWYDRITRTNGRNNVPKNQIHQYFFLLKIQSSRMPFFTIRSSTRHAYPSCYRGFLLVFVRAILGRTLRSYDASLMG